MALAHEIFEHFLFCYSLHAIYFLQDLSFTVANMLTCWCCRCNKSHLFLKIKILLVGLVIRRFNKLEHDTVSVVAKGQIKSLSPPRDKNHSAQTSPLSWKWSVHYLSFTVAETRLNIQPESLLMKVGSKYPCEPPPTKASSQEHHDEISAYLSRHHSPKTNTPICLRHTKAVINMAQ